MTQTTDQMTHVARELLDAAKRLAARGFFSPSSCADAATSSDMSLMRTAINKAASAISKPAPHDPVPERMLCAINTSMNGTPHCSGFSLGECAMVGEICKSHVDGVPVYSAMIYIWNKSFNDSATIAKWFTSAGAESVIVKHVLYDQLNGDRDGWTEEGHRAYDVTFVMKRERNSK